MEAEADTWKNAHHCSAPHSDGTIESWVGSGFGRRMQKVDRRCGWMLVGWAGTLTGRRLAVLVGIVEIGLGMLAGAAVHSGSRIGFGGSSLGRRRIAVVDMQSGV